MMAAMSTSVWADRDLRRDRAVDAAHAADESTTAVMSGNAPSTTMMSGMSPMRMEIASNPVDASRICRSGLPRIRFATFLIDGRIIDEQAALHVPVPACAPRRARGSRRRP